MITVKKELENLGHGSIDVSLGEVSFSQTAKAYKPDELESRLLMLGFSLLIDKKSKMTKQVKSIIKEIYDGNFDFEDGFRFSRLLVVRLGKDYDAISDAFITVEKKTIVQYLIEFRIAKVKEFLLYSNLTLSYIAFKLNFNSVAHLSSQFKQQTGLTPSLFKEIKRKKAESAVHASSDLN